MLDQIIKTKRDRINTLKEHYIINNHLDLKPTKFFQTLLESSNVYKIIGEIKKASPSAGVIKEDFDLLGLAKNYISSGCLLYTSPSPRDKRQSRMPSSA